MKDSFILSQEDQTLMDKRIERFKKTGAKTDITDVLLGSLLSDMSGNGKFQSMLDYFHSKGITDDQIFDPDDGKTNLNPETTKDNMTSIAASMSTNFSKEKLLKMQNMGKQLYPEEVEKAEKYRANPSNFVSDSSNHKPKVVKLSNPKLTKGQKIAAGVAIGTAAAIGTGLIIKTVADKKKYQKVRDDLREYIKNNPSVKETEARKYLENKYDTKYNKFIRSVMKEKFDYYKDRYNQ